MTRFALHVPQHEARLIALAVHYHLSRPGSEIDRETMHEYEHGLAEVLPVIDGQIEEESAEIELSPLQTTLLSTAFSSVISELKMYSLIDAMSGASPRPRSVAPGFDDRLRWLFPEVSGDPSYAGQLAEDMTMLRRELPSQRAKELVDAERQALAQQRKRRKPWQFWKSG
jgi:hypothetical protein